MQNMSHNNAHLHFHPDLTGNVVHIRVRVRYIELYLYLQMYSYLGFLKDLVVRGGHSLLGIHQQNYSPHPSAQVVPVTQHLQAYHVTQRDQDGQANPSNQEDRLKLQNIDNIHFYYCHVISIFCATAANPDNHNYFNTVSPHLNAHPT